MTLAVPRRKKVETPPAETDEAEVRRLLDEAEAHLSAIDRDISEQEIVRDAARAEADEITTSGGSALNAWRAEEVYAVAEARIGQLLTERRPAAERHRALSGIVGPLDRGREEAARIRRAVAGLRKLAEALAAFDRFAELVDEAQIAGRDSGGWFRVPPHLRDAIQKAGDGSMGRAGLLPQLGEADQLTERAARLEAGAAL